LDRHELEVVKTVGQFFFSALEKVEVEDFVFVSIQHHGAPVLVIKKQPKNNLGLAAWAALPGRTLSAKGVAQHLLGGSARQPPRSVSARAGGVSASI